MLRSTLPILALAAACAPSVDQGPTDEAIAASKITVCHWSEDAGAFNTISISIKGWTKGHSGHSDDFVYAGPYYADADGDGFGAGVAFTDDDGDEICPASSAFSDDDSDAFPNDGSEWSDTDGDGVGDNGDLCDGDDATGDGDGDGVCDDLDACGGDDATGDTDGDGVCDDLDACDGDDATGDTDGDGVCDDLDPPVACPCDVGGINGVNGAPFDAEVALDHYLPTTPTRCFVGRSIPGWRSPYWLVDRTSSTEQVGLYTWQSGSAYQCTGYATNYPAYNNYSEGLTYHPTISLEEYESCKATIQRLQGASQENCDPTMTTF